MFPKYPTQSGFRFVFRLNFVALTQMQLSAECHRDTTQDSQELVLKKAQPCPAQGSQGMLVWQICAQGSVTQLV